MARDYLKPGAVLPSLGTLLFLGLTSQCHCSTRYCYASSHFHALYAAEESSGCVRNCDGFVI